MNITSDHIKDLSDSIPGLVGRRLMPTWAYIQQIKHDALIQCDFSQYSIIFQYCELPLIKRIYPPLMVNEKVKKLLVYLAKRSESYSKDKFEQYRELRRYGFTIEESRKRIQPIYSDQFLTGVAKKYKRPFKYKYEITSKDADLLYQIGIDRFIKLFYNKFYEPVK